MEIEALSRRERSPRKAVHALIPFSDLLDACVDHVSCIATWNLLASCEFIRDTMSILPCGFLIRFHSQMWYCNFFAKYKNYY